MRVRRELLIGVVLAVVTIGVYWPVGHYGYLDFDDNAFITENPHINGGLSWQSFKWALTSSVVSNWHPVTTLSHMLDCQLFGMNAGPQHLVNVFCHAVNAVLLFLLLRRMTGAVWRSALVAALFAWHPLRVESVAWIAERKDVLSGLFFLLTLLAYAEYAAASQKVSSLRSQVSSLPEGSAGSPPSPTSGLSTNLHSALRTPHSTFWYVLSLVFFTLGLMSKPMLVTLPFVLLLLDFWPLRRWELRSKNAECRSRNQPTPNAGSSNFNLQHSSFILLFEKLPFFALSAGFCVLTYVLQQNTGAMRGGSSLGWDARGMNAVLSYLRYLWHLVWPVDLAVVYPHPANYFIRSPEWPAWQIPLIGLLLVAVSALCLCQWRRRPWLAVGWFWYLGMMVPVLGLIQVGEQAMADRYTYLPLIGPVFALVWLGDSLKSNVSSLTSHVPGAEPASTRASGPSIPHSAVPTSSFIIHTSYFALLPAGLALVGCLFLTHRQVQYWENTVTLFEHAGAVTAHNASAEFMVGVGLEKQGRISQAMVHYRAALAINPTDPQAHYNMGQVLRKQEHYALAAEHYAAAVRAEPHYTQAHLNLANTLTHLGRNREAATEYEAALRLDPQSLEALNNLAWLLATCPQGEVRDGARAVGLAERGCELTEGKQTFMLGTLAAAYASAGRFPEAVATAEKACALAATSGDEALAAKNRELLELYRSGKAYREEALKQAR